jgi:TM2 domain-containing membrane protein YozV
MLDLAQYEELPPLDITPPATRRNPLIALALSLLFPGLGHLYLGMRRRAGWLIGFESLCLLLIWSGSGTLHGEAIFSAPIIYCFAMADAYFGARERNAGVNVFLVGTNPRIAAVLNLLTKGFGYFYLGDRVKGVVCFIACTTVQAIILMRLNVWTSIFAISLQVAIAVDGYRIARQRLLAANPELSPTADSSDDLIARANPGGLSPAIATVFFLTVGAVFLIGYSTLRAITGHSITTSGVIEQGPDGLIYRNPAEHISIEVPGNWTSNRTQNSLTMLQGGSTSVILLEHYSIAATKSVLESDLKAILGRHPDADISYSPVATSNHATESFNAAFVNKSSTQIHQRIIYGRRGIKLIMLVETWVGADQRLILDQIEHSLKY